MNEARRSNSHAAEIVGVLGAGGYRLVFTADGDSRSEFGDYALTAWSGVRAEHPQGFLLYLRDPDRGRYRLLRPRLPRAARGGDAPEPGMIVTDTDFEDFAVRLEICVGADDLEIRRLTVANRAAQPRRIEITSFIEPVLNDPRAHAGHPVFSKLFLETEHVPDRNLLLVRRRPRGAHERHPVLFHALAGPPVTGYETDRARFVGRGRNPRAPAALAHEAPLAGVTGCVLDPSLSLRTVLELEPGASATAAFVLGAASDREAALARAGRIAADDEIDALTRRAADAGGHLTAEPDAVVGAPRDPGAAPATMAEGGKAISDRLLFDNGHGGFSADGTEYVVRVPVAEDGVPLLPPRPWINVLANESFGFLISETGAGATWSGNSREHRLTPWFNDPLLDPHGEALYVRDEATGESWSLCAGPRPAVTTYEMCHGFGASRSRLTYHDIEHETVFFVAPDAPVKIQLVRLRNRGASPRRLSLFAYDRLVLGGEAAETASTIATEYDAGTGLLLARRSGTAGVAFAGTAMAIAPETTSATADREAFLGSGADPAGPAALDEPSLDGRFGTGLDPCFAQQVVVALDPGEDAEVAFLLGETSDDDAARKLVDRLRAPGAVHARLDAARRFWAAGLNRVRVSTPSRALDLMVNGWLAYQTLACRIWGRTALYQSGGAFGFRDQLQDAAALIPWWPEAARAQILRNAAHQFVEGDVLHWWHPPDSRGIRTRFADDLVWLPALAAHYVRATGDEAIFDESVRFLRAPALAPGEDEVFLVPEDSGETAGVYEHCCRALDRALTSGAHGLPLFGAGDWNDGMNRVGREGRGESVWMGFFLHHALGEFLPFCERRGDDERVRRYRAYRDRVREALETAGWDGDRYLRAYYDDGTPLGSREGDECRIDALVQAWSVISGAAPRSRAERAMDEVERQLVSEDEGLIRLLTPPFDHTFHDPGYIKGYVPGVRENGGQYTHAALWVVQAAALLGRRDRAARWLDLLNPVHHARTPDEVATYQVEPYVICADVYGAPPHVGRGGWTWYTGSAGWMLRVALETILGFGLEAGERLRLFPRIPDDWPGYTIAYRFPEHETRYEIVVDNPDRCAEGVVEARLDGEPVAVADGAALVPVRRDGRVHHVELVLGALDPHAS